MSRMQAKTKVIGPYVNITGPGELGTKIYGTLTTAMKMWDALLKKQKNSLFKYSNTK